MSEVFFTSDHHFNHRKIIEIVGRNFHTLEEMHEYMIEMWNKEVRKDSIVYHLGDFGFAQGIDDIEDIFNRLNGKIKLIKGNHDTKKMITRCSFDEVFVQPTIFNDELILSHKPPTFMPSELNKRYLYGHDHSSHRKTMTSAAACLCVERWGYKPVSYEMLIDLFEYELRKENFINNLGR